MKGRQPVMLTEDEAVEIARKHVESRLGADSLNDRSSSAECEDNGWHVWFPWADSNMLGGEPHVRLDNNGAIVESYSTQ